MFIPNAVQGDFIAAKDCDPGAPVVALNGTDAVVGQGMTFPGAGDLHLPPETVICRLTGDGDGGALLAPDWTRNKRAVLNGIDRWFAEHDSMQGIRYSGGAL